MESTYKSEIYDIAVNTFEVTCYMFPLEEWETNTGGPPLSYGSIQSVVHFHGAANGRMIISPSGDLLKAMAANMLGIENPDANQKEEALCEIANIICGNTVPLFAQDDDICYIDPPEILKKEEQFDENGQEMNKETIEVMLDSGTVEISISYSLGGDQS